MLVVLALLEADASPPELEPDSAVGAAAGVVSFPSLLLSPPALGLDEDVPEPDFDLWSVTYQPEPLKTIPAGVMTLRS